MAAENAHDIDAIMNTFSLTTTGEINGVLLPTYDAVRALHVVGGFTVTPGALEGLTVVPESEWFTQDEVVIEGWLTGRHVKEFLGLGPTNQMVRLRYTAIYLFDDDDKLASERVAECCRSSRWDSTRSRPTRGSA